MTTTTATLAQEEVSADLEEGTRLIVEDNSVTTILVVNSPLPLIATNRMFRLDLYSSFTPTLT